MPECSCCDAGPQQPDVEQIRHLGVDETLGRFADVSVLRCQKCSRLWLRYQLEYEAFSRSGRWAEAVIGDAAASEIMPETAAEFIDAAEWYIYGGSYWGHDGKRGSGRLHWGL